MVTERCHPSQMFAVHLPRNWSKACGIIVNERRRRPYKKTHKQTLEGPSTLLDSSRSFIKFDPSFCSRVVESKGRCGWQRAAVEGGCSDRPRHALREPEPVEVRDEPCEPAVW